MVTTDPPARTGVYAVCGGPIRYWGRLHSDPAPRTDAVDDQDRWAHDRTHDWLTHPHRAIPQ